MIHKFSQFNESTDLKDKVEMKRKLRTLVNEAMLDVEDELTDYDIKYENQSQLILVTLDKKIGESNLFAKSVSDVDRIINEMNNNLKIVELIKESIGKIEDKFDKVWVNFENMNKIAILFIFEKWWDKASNSFSIKDDTLIINRKFFVNFLENKFNLKDIHIEIDGEDIMGNEIITIKSNDIKSVMSELWQELSEFRESNLKIFSRYYYEGNNTVVIELSSWIEVRMI